MVRAVNQKRYPSDGHILDCLDFKRSAYPVCQRFIRGVLIMFPHLQRFVRAEFDAPDMLDSRLLHMLDGMVVEETKRRPGLLFIVHSDFRPGDDGEHGMGRAVDGHFQLTNGVIIPVSDQFLMAIRYNFSGVGFYPCWVRPGVHVDVRPILLTGRKATWWRDQHGNDRAIEEYFA